MNGGTKAGLSTISLEWLQFVRRVSAGPTEGRRRRRKRVLLEKLTGLQLVNKFPTFY
jgi:hypothetical protein